MKNAIIMASGLGTRMMPLTKTTPKPLIKINETPMIETVINGLQKIGVNEINVVVGYLAEQFDYLTDKYSNIRIIRNPYYMDINNISSVYVAKEVLEKGACFICEADLYISDLSIFCKKLKSSCYFGKFVSGHSDDWVFDTDENGIITRVGRSGDDLFNMVGIAFFTQKDSELLYNHISTEYGKSGYEKLFWDDVVNMHINEYSLVVNEVNPNQILEVDTVEELEEARNKYKK